MADARTSGTATERIYSLIGVYGVDGAFDYQKKLHKNVQLYTKSGERRDALARRSADYLDVRRVQYLA